MHYKETDSNPTMGTDTENALFPEPDAVGHGPADQGGVVGPEEATPNSPITPNSSAAPNIGWATPPDSVSAIQGSGPVRYITLIDLFDSIEEVQDFEYSGVCMLAADEPLSVEQALDE